MAGGADDGVPVAVAALLRGLADARERHPCLHRSEPWNAEMLLATVLQRQGRVDEAVAVLRSSYSRGGVMHVNLIEQLAGILAWHDPAALVAFVAGDGCEYAADRLAGELERQGRVDEAVSVLRPFAADGNGNVAERQAEILAELLVRQGRVDEALAVLAGRERVAPPVADDPSTADAPPW
ncbi:hypothetical protein OHA72_28380 [Dactylosporangium sp. NBC_01737]|uniref:hypothetical protein n=1 Tax=Dactylosporangium sp. NBC_01737 TaxID=2975959 RepID=UPI002E1412F6|nr:hypothetical protein OHA72_28380 [Dactylosporangium sp. NBC_01737]